MDVASSNITLEHTKSGVIYHYTTASSFKKIIKNKELRLSNYPDLRGDPQELVWAFRTYDATVGKLFPPSISLQRALPKDFHVFSACLRENNEYLWNVYAEEFRGVVIGLQADALYEEYNLKRNRG